MCIWTMNSPRRGPSTTWTPTRALLRYASKLTETPSLVNKDDIGTAESAGWDESAIWEMTALISFFNFSGRMEAASGLPPTRFRKDSAASPRPCCLAGG
jgi:alkylhydroperoxidase family enzyme